MIKLYSITNAMSKQNLKKFTFLYEPINYLIKYLEKCVIKFWNLLIEPRKLYFL